MTAFAVAKEPFLRGFLKLENGLPSHDTFSRLFRLLDPEQFRAVFQQFKARFAETVQNVVAIDGKVLRRSFDRASGKSALHMVSAWGCDPSPAKRQVMICREAGAVVVEFDPRGIGDEIAERNIPSFSPERCNEVVRSHWGVENRLHWRLDVTMNEGSGKTPSRQRSTQSGGAAPHGAERHALRGKFMRAGWDDRYPARLLAPF